MIRPIIIFLCAVSIAALFQSCNVYNYFTRPVGNFTESYKKTTKSKFSVETPEVFELVNIAYALTENGQRHPWMINKKRYYYTEVRDYFALYTSHPLIKKLNQDIKENESAYIHDRDNALCLEWKNDTIEKNKYRNLSGLYSIYRDKDLWEDFARTSNFSRFYKFHYEEYKKSKETIARTLDVEKIWKWLEKKFPDSISSYKIVVSPLIYGIHTSVVVKEKDYSECIIFFADTPRDTAKYDPDLFKALYTRQFFTVLDNNYTVPLNKKYKKEIKAAIKNPSAWKKGAQADANVYEIFNEYMTWALFSIFAGDNYSESTYSKIVSEASQIMVSHRGYLNFRKFNEKLTELYKSSESGKINDIYPQILNWMSLQ